MHLPFISAGLLFANFVFRPSRAALRPSPLEKSVATDLTSALVPEPVAAWASAVPPANDSFSSPQRPLGSAAVMAIPAIIGLSSNSVHSSFVKLVLSAIDLTPGEYKRRIERPAAARRRKSPRQLPSRPAQAGRHNVLIFRSARARRACLEAHQSPASQYRRRRASPAPCHTSG